MEAGTLMSHYEVAEKLGEGGMGEVYKAWDCQLKRPVALKFLRASQCSPAQIARFEQEARVVAALNHAHIATIHEINEADGRPFLAFEYLPGGTLKAALDQLRSAGQQISLEQGLEYAIQLVDALAYAHREGVIHRDVKTANAMFTSSGALKLTDFGLAKFGEGIDVTQTGTVMGTPATMSPEQARGQETDERSDVFSAGVVLFELFSGEMPFKGTNTAAIIYQVVHEPAPRLGELRLSIPPVLEQIVAKALKKDPGERYQSAGELAQDLRALRRNLEMGTASSLNDIETVVLTGPRPVAEGPVWWKRCSRRTVIAAGSFLAATFLALVTWQAWPVPQTRLAILPFSNIGGDAKDQVFADGFREVLVGKLTGLERPGGLLITVVSKKEAESRQISAPAEAKTRLGANLVLTGTLVRTNERAQFVVHLQDPQSLEERAAQTFDLSSDLSSAASDVARMLTVGPSARIRMALEARRSPAPEAMRLYIEGRGLLQSRSFEAAEQAFRESLVKDDKYSQAWVGLAEAQWLAYRDKKVPESLAKAAGSAEQAVKLDGRLASAHIVLARIRIDQGNKAAASQELETAIKLEPANADAYRALARLYEDESKFEDAERTYQRAIAMRPDDPIGYNNLGYFYYHRETPELLTRAERSFLEAIKLAPDSYWAHYNLSAVYVKQRRLQNAIQEAERSASIAPSAGAYGNLGYIYYYSKKYDQAISAYGQATTFADASYRSWGDLADACRFDHGCQYRAADYYKQAIGLLVAKEIPVRPLDPRLHADLAMYYVSISDREHALAEIAKALGANPAQAKGGVLFDAVLVYEAAGRREQALAAVESLRDYAPNMMTEVWGAPPLEDLRKDSRFVRKAGPRP